MYQPLLPGENQPGNQRAQAQVAEHDHNEIQETLQGLHEAFHQYIHESHHNGASYGITSNAAVVLQSVKQVGHATV